MTALPSSAKPFAVELMLHDCEGQMLVVVGERSGDSALPGWCYLFSSRSEASKGLEAAGFLTSEGAAYVRDHAEETLWGTATVPSAKFMDRMFHTMRTTLPC